MRSFALQLEHQNNPYFSIGLFTFERYFDDKIITCGLLCLLDCGQNFDSFVLEQTGAHLIYEHLQQKVYVISPIKQSQSVYLYPLQSHLLQTLEVSAVSKLSSNPRDDFLSKIADKDHFLSFIHQSYAIGDICFAMTYPSQPYKKDDLFNNLIDYIIANGDFDRQDVHIIDKIVQMRFDEQFLLKTTHTTNKGEAVYDCSDLLLNNLKISVNHELDFSHIFYHYKKNRLCHFFSELSDYERLYDSMTTILHEQKQLGLSFDDSLTHFMLYGFILCGQPTTAFIKTNGLYPILWEQISVIYTSDYNALYDKASQAICDIPSSPMDFAFGVVENKVNDYNVCVGGVMYHHSADVFIMQSVAFTKKIALIINKNKPTDDYTPPSVANFMFKSINFDNFILLLAYKNTEYHFESLEFKGDNADDYFVFFEPLFLLQIGEHIKANKQKQKDVSDKVVAEPLILPSAEQIQADSADGKADDGADVSTDDSTGVDNNTGVEEKSDEKSDEVSDNQSSGGIKMDNEYEVEPPAEPDIEADDKANNDNTGVEETTDEPSAPTDQANESSAPDEILNLDLSSLGNEISEIQFDDSTKSTSKRKKAKKIAISF